MTFREVQAAIVAEGYSYGPPRWARDPAEVDRPIVEALPCPACGAKVTYHQYHREERWRPLGTRHLGYRAAAQCPACGWGEEI